MHRLLATEAFVYESSSLLYSTTRSRGYYELVYIVRPCERELRIIICACTVRVPGACALSAVRARVNIVIVRALGMPKESRVA